MKVLPVLKREEADEKGQEIFDKLQKKLGRVINIYGAMANSSHALDALLTFGNILRQGELSAIEAEAVALYMGQVNDCHYCLAAHSKIARSLKLSDEQINELRQGKSSDAKLNALVVLVKEMIDKKGYIDQSVLDNFLDAGYSKAAVVEVIGFISLNYMTNYFNHVADVECDFPEPPVLEV
jgi:uncharacterized peroxidase-related enzyme